MNINELRQLAGLKEFDTRTSTPSSKEVNMGSGDWDRIAKELGFKNKKEFIQAQLKSGTPDMKKALNNPNKYANQKIAFVSSPDIAASTVNQPVLAKDHVPPKPKGHAANVKVKQWTSMYGRSHNADGSPKAPASTVDEPDKKGWVRPRPVQGAVAGHWDRVYGRTHNKDGSPKAPASTIDAPDGTQVGQDVARQTANDIKNEVGKAKKHILELISAQAKSYNCNPNDILAKIKAAGGKLVSKKV